MKILTVLGTRPEIIKLSALIPLLDEKCEHRLLHTGQHYDANMDTVFFEKLKLRKPDINLNVGSHTHGKQTSIMLEKIEEELLTFKPDKVVCLGDTNSTLACAIATSKLNIPFIHLESGCRSFIRTMPEEINRLVSDHVADVLVTPDQRSVDNLCKEGVAKEKIHLLGDFVFDAVERNKKFADFNLLAQKYGISEKKFVVTTIHRAEHTDTKENMSAIFDALDKVAEKIPVIFPMHPRTKAAMERLGVILENVTVTEPADYLDLLGLLSNAKFCITDSGGIQKESLALNVPCLITRDTTEWMDAVDAGKNFLVGNTTDGILTKANEFLDDETKLIEVNQRPVNIDEKVSEKLMNTVLLN